MQVLDSINGLIRRRKIQHSLKSQVLIAFLLSLWLVIFLIVIAPFDIAELSFSQRLQLMPLYGLITFSIYMLMVPLQNWIYKIYQFWSILHEILFILLFQSIVLFINYAYYKSSFVNGAYSFFQFSTEIYYPIFFVLVTVIVFLRWYLFRKKEEVPNDKIVLEGENKLDTLQIKFSDLISISSADNYSEVNYIIDGKANKKLLRSTLKKLENEHPELMRIHRSHLINPSHFIEWVDSKTIKLTQTILPVTKTYKDSLETIKSRP